jgi:hypothetical protein
MCCVRFVIWPVYCVCGGVSAVEGDGRVGWMGRCAGGQYRCMRMPPVAMPWVWDGVFWFLVILCDGMLVFVARCVSGGGVCDDLGLCMAALVVLYGSSVRTALAPIAGFMGMHILCSVPCLVPGMCRCVSLYIWFNERSETRKSLQSFWAPYLIPVPMCFSLSPCICVQDASSYLHVSQLIMLWEGRAPSVSPLPETSGALWCSICLCCSASRVVVV